MKKTKGDKEEQLNKDLRAARLDEEEMDPGAIKAGMKDEGKEHPTLDKKVIKQLVMDHLQMDDNYYEKDKKGKKED